MKIERSSKIELKGKCENPQDIKNFDTMVSLMFNDQKVKPVDIPSDVFGEGFRNSHERRYGYDNLIKGSVRQLYHILHMVRELLPFFFFFIYLVTL